VFIQCGRFTVAANDVYAGALVCVYMMQVTFCRADVKSVHDVSGEQLLTRERAMSLSLAERLSLIARSLLMHQQWYDLDAGLPPALLASAAAAAAAAHGQRDATASESTEKKEEPALCQEKAEPPSTAKQPASAAAPAAGLPGGAEDAEALPKDEGKRWLEAAKSGELELLQEMLRAWVEDCQGDTAAILTCQGCGK
jgi:hypothetical protein